MEPNTQAPGDVIRRAREARDWSQDDLAREAGVSQPAIVKIENGKTRKSKYFPKIAQVLEIPLDRLDPTLAHTPDPSLMRRGDQRELRRDLKLYGSVEGGPGQIVITTDPVDYIERPPALAHSPDGYAVLVTGTSMEPEFRPGYTIFVHPHYPIIGGESYVFYSEQDGEVRTTIKHLRRATEDRWLVTQHNPPDGQPKDFALSRREWQRAERVVGTDRRR